MKLYFIPKLPADKRQITNSAITLVEVLLTVSLLGLMMAAMVPFIHTVHTAWNSGDRKIQLQQNARVGLEMISRFARQSARLKNIPETAKANFIQLRSSLDNQTIIFYHNIPGSPYYAGNSGLIRENDLVMATLDSGPVTSPAINNVLLAKSLSSFAIYFKDRNGQLTAEADKVSYMDISMRLSDAQNLFPETLEVSSSISIRSDAE